MLNWHSCQVCYPLEIKLLLLLDGWVGYLNCCFINFNSLKMFSQVELSFNYLMSMVVIFVQF